jgi:hypothetical protein
MKVSGNTGFLSACLSAYSLNLPECLTDFWMELLDPDGCFISNQQCTEGEEENDSI